MRQSGGPRMHWKSGRGLLHRNSMRENLINPEPDADRMWDVEVGDG